MNLIVTDKCTNSCPYCFAAYEMQKHSEQNILSKENIDVFLDFLESREQFPVIELPHLGVTLLFFVGDGRHVDGREDFLQAEEGLIEVQ